jgi:hypothetical protein
MSKLSSRLIRVYKRKEPLALGSARGSVQYRETATRC